MSDPASRRAVSELYAGQGWPVNGDELLHQSLAPRSPGMLLEAPGWLGLGAGQLVVDAGCRDASHAAALVQRYSCRVVGVDLVLAGLPKGGAYHAAAATAGQVSLIQGDLQTLPMADGTVDLVWCRDTLSCLPDCALALAECARVLRPGGGMVLYAVFATERLEPGDRALLMEGLGNSAASMHQPTVEAAIAAAGFEIARRERIGSEWTEHRPEHDPAYLTQDLLEVARLTRHRDRFQQVLGPVWYRRALAFDLWRLQIVLGRLVPVLYALVKGTSPAGRAPVTDLGENGSLGVRARGSGHRQPSAAQERIRQPPRPADPTDPLPGGLDHLAEGAAGQVGQLLALEVDHSASTGLRSGA
jgi:SAM-dependent methyltransferase